METGDLSRCQATTINWRPNEFTRLAIISYPSLATSTPTPSARFRHQSVAGVAAMGRKPRQLPRTNGATSQRGQHVDDRSPTGAIVV